MRSGPVLLRAHGTKNPEIIAPGTTKRGRFEITVAIMNKDVELYCKCMTQLLERMALVHSVFAKRVTTGYRPADTEFVFLQFRKMLELIAFGSLVANKDEYSKARASFAQDWRAKDMLRQLEKLNPDFYPLPVTLASTTTRPDGRTQRHLEPLTHGFLTKDDFIKLYDYCGDVLHAQNPYNERTTIKVRLSPQAWLTRIENLVKLHRAKLITGTSWFCAVPDKDGTVRTYTGVPLNRPQSPR